MQPDNPVGPSEPLVKMVGKHGLRPVNRLLRWLAHKDQRAVPLRFHRRHRARRTDHHRRVHIVPASVHHTYRLPGAVLHRHVARIRHSGFFNDRQRIHIRADHQRRPRTILQDPNHPISLRSVGIPPHTLRHCVTGIAHRRGQKARRARLEVRKLRMRVNIFVSVDQRRGLGLHKRRNVLGHDSHGRK